IVRARDLAPDPVDDALPRLLQVVAALESLAAQLVAHGPEQLATEVDPSALPVRELRSSGSLAGLTALADADPDSPAGRAVRAIHRDLAAAAICNPPSDLVDSIGPRPDGGPARRAWDRAICVASVHRAHWGNDPPATPADDREVASWRRVQAA